MSTKPRAKPAAKPAAKRPKKLHSFKKGSKEETAFHRRHRLYPIAGKSPLGRALLGSVAFPVSALQ